MKTDNAGRQHKQLRRRVRKMEANRRRAVCTTAAAFSACKHPFTTSSVTSSHTHLSPPNLKEADALRIYSSPSRA
ncbi:hypothetical protein PBY51_004503 [Eleginops maclovinus]|uniref:Uncharacterized protein n=1 Tax=Eleginops maclovinus TaxID=56733 RepID=A0AAN7XX00_ELEMC|nr:hypothetical protein PBY51_004503 [Eleginops maclovinus]